MVNRISSNGKAQKVILPQQVMYVPGDVPMLAIKLPLGTVTAIFEGLCQATLSVAAIRVFIEDNLRHGKTIPNTKANAEALIKDVCGISSDNIGYRIG